MAPSRKAKPVLVALTALIAVAAALALLTWAARVNYLLFHSVVELFSVAVAWTVFAVLINARKFLRDSGLLFLGGAYLLVGSLDLLHTLSYDGMGVFPHRSANLPTQFWIVARGFEAASLLIAAWLTQRSLSRGGFRWVLLGQVVFAAALVGVVFAGYFPACFVPGRGLTGFKIAAEYLICACLLLAGVVFYRQRKRMDPQLLHLLIASVGLTIASELAFTLYGDVFGVMNLVGHLLKLGSFLLIYVSFVRIGLERPYETLFRSFREEEQQNRQLEKRIHDARRMESLGVMAEGIAHDFNNLLAAIMGNAELAAQAARTGADQQENFDAIVQASRRAEQLTQKMLAYTGTIHLRPEPVQLGRVCRQLQEVVGHLDTRVRLNWELQEDLPAVCADPEQIRQVVAALLQNALEALEGSGGRVTIRTALAEVADGQIVGAGQIDPLPPGSYCMLQIEDDGQGMDEETLSFALDPFFSTRFTGRGLGLPAVHGILKTHKGALTLDSSPGKGTVVTVYLPALREPVSEGALDPVLPEPIGV